MELKHSVGGEGGGGGGVLIGSFLPHFSSLPYRRALASRVLGTGISVCTKQDEIPITLRKGANRAFSDGYNERNRGTEVHHPLNFHLSVGVECNRI